EGGGGGGSLNIIPLLTQLGSTQTPLATLITIGAIFIVLLLLTFTYFYITKKPDQIKKQSSKKC
ncbi:MAG: hypothetical protein HWN67_07250, partial [Candidatus Helarchaeota archaeon]|nr:hypothetical protein [Candidatus Helarchaeota archaeon]